MESLLVRNGDAELDGEGVIAGATFPESSVPVILVVLFPFFPLSGSWIANDAHLSIMNGVLLQSKETNV
jgi:hypothetical protein